VARSTGVAQGRSRPARRGRVARLLNLGDTSTVRSTELRTAALFVAPAFVLYFLFMLYPFLNSIYFSLTSWNGATVVKEFVGLGNYIEMFKDQELYAAFARNAVWIVLGTIAPVAIGLLLALTMWTNKRGALTFRTIFFLPFIVPIVVIGIVWGWIYHPIYGILNSVLRTVGLDSLTRGWLGDRHTALIAVLIAAVWGAFGFVTTILFAGLQSVDVSLVEAAEIDGANWFQRARYVIVPAIAPVLTLVTAITLIGGFSVIDFILIMTGGGPGTSTEVLGFYAYKNGFQENRVGYGSALSMLITVLTLIAAIAFVRFRERGRE
jgi:raffinose/stachyose/melibiose transport system permease protein